MRSLRAWCLRFAALFRKEHHDRELAEELESHLQMHIENNLRSGMGPEEARRQALIKLGGVEQAKEKYRDRRGIPVLENVAQDLRFGLRMLRKNPGFTIVALVSLGLGIGANTAIFSVVNTVLLHPLPYPQPDRIVQLEISIPGNDNFFAASIPKYMIWREQTQVFEDAALYSEGPYPMNLTGGEHPEQLTSMQVSSSYFRLFGARVGVGRVFTAEEDVANGPLVAVISSGLWRNRYGGDPGVVGKNIEIGGEPYQVIGILDANFRWDTPIDVWLPLGADPNSANQSNDLLAAARLKPGVSLEQAKAAMKVAYATFRRKFPDAQDAGDSFTAELLEDDQVVSVRPALLLLAGTVVLVLLSSCSNVANLQLARAEIRRREMAIRAALGAGRGRILRQVLTESVLLSVGGGTLGLAAGYFGVHALLAINPGNIPRIGEKGADVAMDWPVVAFTLGVSLLTGILFGLIPAIHASRANLNVTLKEGGSRSGGGLRQNKTRSILVLTEIALAFLLITGSGLLIRSYIALRSVAPGFDPHNILTMGMTLDGPRFQKTAGVDQLVRDGVERIESLPGVEAAATASSLPLEPTYHETFTIEGRHVPKDGYHGASAWRSISPNYFKVFRIPLLRGRLFDNRDSGGSPPVALINETLAAQFWPMGDPLGERITIDKGAGPPFAEPPREIIGVVADVRDDEPNRAILPTIYIPVSQVSDGLTALNNQNLPTMWVIRTRVAPDSLSADIQRELRAASGGLPAGDIRSMEQVILESTARNDFNTTLMTIFAGAALILAAIGIYGLMAYTVQQRNQEIGIRMALGAQPGDVLRMVQRDGALLCIAGIAIGISGAFAVTRLLKSLIFGVSPTDPVTFISVAILLAAVAFAACWIPARRASRVDPMVALRHE